MEFAKRSNEQIVASEAFTPVLSGEYIERYNTLIEKLAGVLPANRVSVIRKEISLVSEGDETLDLLKYLASLSVLIDLSQQGWVFDIEDKKLVLRMEIDNIDDKKMLRYRLSAERNAQFKADSVASFIRRMEADKKYNNGTLSIKRIGESVCTDYLGFAPTSNATKPPHIANGLFRACLGETCRTTDVHEWLICEGKKDAVSSEQIISSYHQILEHGQMESPSNIKDLRFLLNEIFNQDNTTYPSYDFSVTTISSHWMVKKRVSG